MRADAPEGVRAAEHGPFVYHTRAWVWSWLLLALLLALALPATAAAHGPIDPEASNDVAHVTSTPPGIRARVVDGDLRLWISVARREHVIVMDYQGGEYLRLGPRGVEVNENSPMFYLNLIPPITPSIRLTPAMRPDWSRISSGHSVEWHDGRIAALASALTAGSSRDLGDWTIPLRVDGRAARIVGRLLRSPAPSRAWLWPIAVVALTLPACLRLRDPTVERRVGRALAWLTLLGAAAASLGAGLHGRPGLSALLLTIMGVELVLLAWCAQRLVRRRDGPLVMAAIAVVALFRGLAGFAVLWRGHVLLAVGTDVGRAAVAVCLAGGVSLVVLGIVAVDRGTRAHGLRGRVGA